MHSLAKFDVKCRFSLQNTVSASKRCEDWEMHSLAKFHVKCRISFQNTNYKTQTPCGMLTLLR